MHGHAKSGIKVEALSITSARSSFFFFFFFFCHNKNVIKNCMLKFIIIYIAMCEEM